MSNSSVRFEDILDNCITSMQTGGGSVASCLARHPEQREELEPLLHLANALSAAKTVTAPEPFRSTAVTRMTNIVATRPRQARRETKTSNPVVQIWRGFVTRFGQIRRFPLAAGLSLFLALVLILGGGVGFASATALPGDVLYAIKLVGERSQLALSLDAAGDARLRLRFADRRLDEAGTLLAQGRSEDAALALENYATQVSWAMVFLARDDVSPSKTQVALADQMMTSLTEHEWRLAALFVRLPENAQDAAELALAASQTGRRRALTVLSLGPGDPDRPPAIPDLPFDSPLPTQTLSPTGTATPTATPSFTPSPSPTRTPTPTSTLSPTPTLTPWIVSPLPTPWPKPTWHPEDGPPPRPPVWPTEWPWPPRLPREWPTALPAELPTTLPSEWPTGVPSEWPSGVPTEWPTGLPTEWSSDAPASFPTPIITLPPLPTPPG